MFLWFLELHTLHFVTDLVGEDWVSSKWKDLHETTLYLLYIYTLPCLMRVTC